MTDDQLAQLARDLPPAFARTKVTQFFPGMLAAGTLANLDSKGLGPRRIKIGPKVGYTRDDFLCWLRQRSEAA